MHTHVRVFGVGHGLSHTLGGREAEDASDGKQEYFSIFTSSPPLCLSVRHLYCTDLNFIIKSVFVTTFSWCLQLISDQLNSFKKHFNISPLVCCQGEWNQHSSYINKVFIGHVWVKQRFLWEVSGDGPSPYRFTSKYQWLYCTNDETRSVGCVPLLPGTD